MRYCMVDSVSRLSLEGLIIEHLNRSHVSGKDATSELFLISWFFFLKSKNLFSAFRTPAVLFVLVCFLYVLSGVLLFVGLSTFALVCDCTLGLVMMAMLMWAFIRYSGRYRPMGGAIDQAAGIVLEQVGTNLLTSLFAPSVCVWVWVCGSSMYEHFLVLVKATRGRNWCFKESKEDSPSLRFYSTSRQ